MTSLVKPSILRTAALVGLVAGLAASGTTYGTGVNPGTQTVKDLTGMLTLGAGKDNVPIAYEARLTGNREHQRILREGFGTAIPKRNGESFGKGLAQMTFFSPEALSALEEQP